MQYTEVHIDYTRADEWTQDLLTQDLADIGYEAFDESIAYIQTRAYSEEALQAVLAQYPDVHLTEVRLCEDRNWNETWENESYDPNLLSSYGIRIIPHNAFGSGTHPTTCMILEHLQQLTNYDKVLDMGCGTGVLGIYCATQGAEVTAVDIDEWSIRNTEENAEINGVFVRTLLRDGTLPLGTCNLELASYDLILANIHRNILVADLPLYHEHLTPGGRMIFSGFYEDDIVPIQTAAEALGLHITHIRRRDEWRMIELTRN